MSFHTAYLHMQTQDYVFDVSPGLGATTNNDIISSLFNAIRIPTPNDTYFNVSIAAIREASELWV